MIQNYSLDKKISPMDDHVKNILTIINENPVTNVISSTSTGKTTRLPSKISESGNKIYVVVSDSGIANSLQLRYLRYNKVKYLSSSEMKKHMYAVSKTKNFDFDILMIDEADSRSLDNFIIMSMWKYLAEKNIKVPKLLLVSNTEVITSLFDTFIYNIDSNIYPVEIRYDVDNYPLSNNLKLINKIVNLVYNYHNSSIKGSFLIFTSDKFQIETVIRRLEELKMKNVDIYPAHEDLTQGEIDRIYKNNSNRKILVADKLAETTFTMEDLSVIIDTMLDFKPELSISGGSRTSLKYITKQQANTRSLRGSKYNQVLCYRMITPNLYNKLNNTTQPEILRTPLHQIMLELYENNINPYDILTFFDKKNLNRNYSLMIKLGVINPLNKVTDVGIFVKNIDFGLRNSVALHRWIKSNQPTYPAVVILSMIDSFEGSYFVYPLKEKDVSFGEYTLELLEYRKEYFNPFEGISDVHTYSHIWNDMMDDVGGPEVPSSDIKRWCGNNGIRYDKIFEVMSIINNTLDRIGIGKIGPFDTDNTMKLLGPVLADIYSDRKYYLDKNTEIRVRYCNKEKYYKIDSMSINTIEINTPETVFGLITSTISSDYESDFNLISCSLVLN